MMGLTPDPLLSTRKFRHSSSTERSHARSGHASGVPSRYRPQHHPHAPSLQGSRSIQQCPVSQSCNCGAHFRLKLEDVIPNSELKTQIEAWVAEGKIGRTTVDVDM
jgi:hypothetical protein